MKPVNQTIFGDGKGNCFAACVASILELPLADVPNFCVEHGEEWYAELEKWLEPRGLAAVSVCFDHGRQVTDPEALTAFFIGDRGFYLRKEVPLILSGLNHEGVAHCVVLYEGTKIHNPNPDGTQLVSYRDLMAFVSLCPEKSQGDARRIAELERLVLQADRQGAYD